MNLSRTEDLNSTEQLGPAVGIRVEVVGAGSTMTFDSGSVTVGSGTDADLRLDDRAVSRRHALLQLLPGAVRVTDLESRNGTHYLGARITTATVPHGGSVQVGRSTLRFIPYRTQRDDEITADGPAEMVGRTPVMRRLFAKMKRVAPLDSPVLIEGESGVGKETVSRAIHALSTPSQPLVVLDCAGINPNIIEAELFGVARGAFTGADRARAGLFEQATGGTLVIEEPASLPLELQPRLLRVLESKEFKRIGENVVRKTRTRIITVSCQDLDAEVAAGRFRRDLLFRLAILRIRVPALRERREDIPLLATHLARLIVPGATLAPSILAAFQCHTWPGNVRELRNSVERAVLGLETFATQRSAIAAPSFLEARDTLLHEFEQRFLADLLRRNSNNVSQAAREAKLARSFFYKLLRKHGLVS